MYEDHSVLFYVTSEICVAVDDGVIVRYQLSGLTGEADNELDLN